MLYCTGFKCCNSISPSTPTCTTKSISSMFVTTYVAVFLLSKEHNICIDSPTYEALIGRLFVPPVKTALNENNTPVWIREQIGCGQQFRGQEPGYNLIVGGPNILKVKEFGEFKHIITYIKKKSPWHAVHWTLQEQHEQQSQIKSWVDVDSSDYLVHRALSVLFLIFKDMLHFSVF